MVESLKGKAGNEEPELKSILRNKKDKSPIARVDSKNNLFMKDDYDYGVTELSPGKVSWYNPSAKSVKSYAYEENPNIEYRKSMEDMQKIVDGFNKDPCKGYFSLFDGHGSIEMVEFIRERLLAIFTSLFKDKKKLDQILIKSFQVLDKELKSFKNIENIGATGTVLFITKETDTMVGSKRVWYCANVGDTRGVWLNSGGCKRWTLDHICSEESEVARIKKAGGNIQDNRVFGKLAITRTFGDYSMKRFGVIATPTVNKIVLNDSDKFIVLCSDGVWDVINEEDMFYYSFNYDDPKELADKIVEDSLANGSTDNISCIVLKW